MRPLASKLAKDTNLSHYKSVYDVDNKKVKAPVHDSQDLTPPIHKNTFSLDADPSTLISDEAIFRALSGINWATTGSSHWVKRSRMNQFWTIHNLQLVKAKTSKPQAGLAYAFCETVKTIILLGHQLPCNRLAIKQFAAMPLRMFTCKTSLMSCIDPL